VRDAGLILDALVRYEVSEDELSTILGKIVFQLQFARPYMSILSAAFESFRSGHLGVVPVRLQLCEELFLCLCIMPDLWSHLRLKISGEVVATDASSSGGGSALSTGLTPKGLSHLEKFTAGPAKVLLVSTFDGIGGARMALKLLRIQPCGYIAIEIDKFARRVVRESFPEVHHVNDVQEVTEDVVRQWKAWHGCADTVLHVSGFPCQDLSSLNADRKGLDGEKSGLFSYTLKVQNLLEKVFTTAKCLFLYENVASMPAAAAAEITAACGVEPLYFEAAEVSHCRRPRLFWANFRFKNCDDWWVSERVVHNGREVKVRDGIKGQGFVAIDRFLEDGCRPFSDAWETFLCFTLPEKRSKPGFKPCGVDRASSDALYRWEADFWRLPPYQYEDHNLVREKNGKVRLPSGDERLRMLGFPSHYCDVVEKMMLRRDVEDTKCRLAGNSFSVIVVAIILLGADLPGIADLRPDDLDELWDSWLACNGTAKQRKVVAKSWSKIHGGKPGASSAADSLARADLSKEQLLVAEYGRLADHRGSDIRLDAGTPYRLHAWPRAPIDSALWHWKVYKSYSWRVAKHINVLEAQAVFDFLRAFAKNMNNHRQKKLCLIDSQAALGVLTKGRSSSHQLNFVLRRLAAVSRASRISLMYGWVPSEGNPADGPSRWATKKQ
jgi:hypothetical protein